MLNQSTSNVCVISNSIEISFLWRGLVQSHYILFGHHAFVIATRVITECMPIKKLHMGSALQKKSLENGNEYI